MTQHVGNDSDIMRAKRYPVLMHTLHVLQRNQYSSRTRKGEVVQERTWLESTSRLPTKSAGGKEYEYIVVDDYSRAVYTRPLRLKSDTLEAFKIFKAAAEKDSQKRNDGQRARVEYGRDEAGLRARRN